MDKVSKDCEATEEDMELISFRKTNTSVEENMMDLDNQDYILIQPNFTKGMIYLNILNKTVLYLFKTNSSFYTLSKVENLPSLVVDNKPIQLEKHNQKSKVLFFIYFALI